MGYVSAKVRSLGWELEIAKPRLILRADISRDSMRFKPLISDGEFTWDEVLDEGYDQKNSPLGPVYWRIVRRGEERLYCSTFRAYEPQILNAWGKSALAYCDPISHSAIVRIESHGRGEMPDDPAARQCAINRRAEHEAEQAQNKADEARLRTAKIDFTICAFVYDEKRVELMPATCDVEGHDEVVEEGFDANGSPFGPVYWRMLKRRGEALYSSIFEAPPPIVESWKRGGLIPPNAKPVRQIIALETRASSTNLNTCAVAAEFALFEVGGGAGSPAPT